MQVKHRFVGALRSVLPESIRARIFNFGYMMSPEQFRLFS